MIYLKFMRCPTAQVDMCLHGDKLLKTLWCVAAESLVHK